MQQAEEVFQLQQQHWRLADASWSLITLLQKAAATLASLGPQGPGLIRRLTPNPQGGSTKGPAALPLAGTADQSGELVCMLENARKGCCAPGLLYACFRLQGRLQCECLIHCMHASGCKERLVTPSLWYACLMHGLVNAREGCETPSLHQSNLILDTDHKSLAPCNTPDFTFAHHIISS